MTSIKLPPRRVRRAEEMFPLLQAWEDSDLSQKEFCIRHRIKLHVFWYWLRRYRSSEQTAIKQAQGFVSVEMEEAPGEAVFAEVIFPDGTRLVIKERVGLEFLQGLLARV